MKKTYNFKVSPEGILALKIIYEDRIQNPEHHTISEERILNSFSKEKHRQIRSELRYFVEKRALNTIMHGWFSITYLGILILNKRGIESIISKGIALKVLQAFPSELSDWISDDKIDSFIEKGTEVEIWYAFLLLKGVGYLETEHTIGRLLPYSARITAIGRDHQEDMCLFQEYIPFNEREFQLKVSDKKIFSWIESINRIENLEVEFKSSLPTTPELRRIITGMANGDSGIIFIGIADNGTPIGIDDPDQAKRQINQALRNFEIEIKFRTIQDEKENKILMIMIPSTQEFYPVGSDIYLRKDGEFNKLTPKEVYLEYKAKQVKNLWGFTFLLSLN